jgi:hypothetical protein
LRGDGNDNNAVDMDDYGIWSANFGDSGGGASRALGSPVPEPTLAVALLPVAIAGLFRRRCRS